MNMGGINMNMNMNNIHHNMGIGGQWGGGGFWPSSSLFTTSGVLQRSWACLYLASSVVLFIDTGCLPRVRGMFIDALKYFISIVTVCYVITCHGTLD